MSAYYNEIDPYAAQWLRNLIKAGHIADGIVDERSIEDVRPDDLRGYTQCHFFAGIGVWSHALRLAGWPDDRRIWTGSCPCQPFSAAGKGAGFDDERHLWPAFNHLILQCQPAIVVGEQVTSSDAAPWLDLVQTDLERMGYAFGAVAFPAASVGAPHIRDRSYWVANAESLRGVSQRETGEHRSQWSNGIGGSGEFSVVANAHDARPQGRGGVPERADQCTAGAAGVDGRMGNSGSSGRQQFSNGNGCDGTRMATGGREQVEPCENVCDIDTTPATSPTNGHWRDADWLLCRDGKWRPVEPGTFPLAHGVTGRVGRLRAYGNAIVAQAAAAFIGSVM